MVDSMGPRAAARDKMKLLLIPLLGIALLVVLFGQRDASSDDPSLAPLAAATESAASTGRSTSPAARAPWSERDRTTLIPLDVILANNPFAIPDVVLPPPPPQEPEPPLQPPPPPLAEDEPVQVVEVTPPAPILPAVPTQAEIDAAQRQESLNRWRNCQITAFYETGDRPVALVNSQVLHEGDILENSVRVVEIRSDAVTYDVYVP